MVFYTFNKNDNHSLLLPPQRCSFFPEQCSIDTFAVPGFGAGLYLPPWSCLCGFLLLLLECSIRGSPFVTSPTSFGPQTGNHSPSSMAFRSIIDFITSLSINSRLKCVMFINEYVHPASISVFTTLFLSYLGSNLYPLLIHLKPVQTQKRLIQVSNLDVPHLHK